MSTKVLALCWEYPAETAAEKLILLKIGDQSNDYGQSIYFSMKTYARAGLLRSTRGARKILRRLEEKEILLDDPEFAAELRAKGRAVRARVYRLNLPKIREAIEEANRNPVPIDDYGEPELSSASADETNRNSVPVESELSSSNTYLESFTDNPLNPPEQDFTEDFDKLVAAWKPFDMLTGDLPQAKRKYTKIRGEGVSAEQVMLAARVYCQQCWNTRCKTKHIENWLGQCVWKSEDKGLGDGSNGKSRDKKPASAEAEKPRELRYQPWHATAKQQLGDTVYRAWIERLWLEGDIVYCPTRFTAEYVQQQYGRAIIAAIGHEVRYIAELPPQHAFADFVEQSAGENHGQDQITA